MPRIFTILFVLAINSILGSAQSTAPAVVNGELAPVNVGTQSTMTNVISAAFSSQGIYSTNTYVANGNSGWITNLQSDFTFVKNRDRSRVSVEYSPSALLDYQGQTGSDMNQKFGADVSYQVARHTNVRLHDVFSIDNSILRSAALEVVPEFGLLNQPNDNLLAPYSRRTYEQVGVDVQQMLSSRTSFTISGNFNEVNFHSLSPIAGNPDQLIDTRNADGEASYSYRLSRRHSIGVMYQYQTYWVQGVDSGGQTQGAFYTHNITFNNKMSLSVYVGPQYSRSYNPIFVNVLNNTGDVERHSLQTQFSGWSVSGGTTFQVQGRNTGITFSAVRSVNNGNGLSSGSRYTDLGGSFRRQFRRKWTTGLAVDYSQTGLLSGASQVQYQAVSGSAFVQRSLRHGLMLSASYSRTHQADGGVLQGLTNLDRDQVAVSMTYQFSRGLGH